MLNNIYARQALALTPLVIASVSIYEAQHQSPIAEKTTSHCCLPADHEHHVPEARWIEVCVPEGNAHLALFTPPSQDHTIGTFQHMGVPSSLVASALPSN